MTGAAPAFPDAAAVLDQLVSDLIGLHDDCTIDLHEWPAAAALVAVWSLDDAALDHPAPGRRPVKTIALTGGLL